MKRVTVPCARCEGRRTSVYRTIPVLDAMKPRIVRVSRCKDCGERFLTVEHVGLSEADLKALRRSERERVAAYR